MPTLTIRRGAVYSYIVEPLPFQVKKEISKQLSYIKDGWQFTPSGKAGNWDGKVTLFNKTTYGPAQAYPSGLEATVLEVLASYNCPVTIVPVDKYSPAESLGIEPSDDIVLRDYQNEAIDVALSRKRMIINLPTGCHRKGQQILMYDGTLKAVEDITIGDQLMGPDSNPRNVLQLCRGAEAMVEIQPVKGAPWIVNRSHILTLTRTSEASNPRYPCEFRAGEVLDVSIRDWDNWPKYRKHIYKLFRVGVEFRNENTLTVSPYMLGVLLGDGFLATKGCIGWSKPDIEIVDALQPELDHMGLKIRTLTGKDHYIAQKKRGGKNKLLDLVRELGLSPIKSEDRFVPQHYKTADRISRLELLAGLLDTDGHLSSGNYYEFISKSRQLAEDVAFLARSLGLAAYYKEKTQKEGIYHRVTISGNCEIIPCKIPRKQASTRHQKKDVTRTGFKVKETGTVENYYGFVLDGDGRYLLGDFTVTHNTGKTVVAGEFIRQVNQKPTLFCVYHSKELLTQTIRNFNQQLGCSIGKIGNGAFELDDITVAITDSLATAIKKRDIKTLDYLKSVKCIIFDEVHHARAETVQAIAKACPNAEYRIGLSGTPARDSGDDLEIVAYIGPIAYEKSITWMVEHGYLVRPVIYYVKLRGNSSRFDNYRDLMSTYICDNPERDKFIAFLAKQLESKGHRGLVLAEQVNHGEALSKLIPGADFIHGGDSASYRQAVIDDLTNNQTNTVVATSIIREGVDIPPASYLIHAHPFKSFVVTWQRNGRVLRPFPGKEKAVIVDIVDTGNKWLPAHGARRLKYYRQEPCFDIKEREATLKA